MRRDHWTLLLLRGHRAPRQYSLSPRVVHYGVGALTLVVLTLSGALAAVAGDGGARFEAYRLRQANRVLTEELGELRTRVQELEGDLDGLAEESSRVRLLAGLDSLDPDVLQVGVGGPGLATPQVRPLWPVDSTLAKASFAVAWDLNALERRARLLTESLGEAGDSLRAHRELLQATPSILPAAGMLSSRFTRRRHHPIHHRAMPHEGVDVSAPEGTPILAAARGRVVRAEWVSGYGQLVEIDHGYGFVTRYGHASRLLVRAGQTVERGEVIAHVGDTGVATASHLHYEVHLDGRPQNPMNYVLSGSLP